jgi:hypothetical protein
MSHKVHKNRSDKPMKYFKRFTCFATLSTIVLAMGAWSVLPVNIYAAELNDAQQKPVVEQRWFASPDEAVKALQAATEAKDKTALSEIFGSQVQELLTGDEVQDAKNAQRFAAVMAQGNTPVNESEDKIILEVGTNNWPMPIPLVKVNGQWHFDTAAGKEEIINHRRLSGLCGSAEAVCQREPASRRKVCTEI